MVDISSRDRPPPPPLPPRSNQTSTTNDTSNVATLTKPTFSAVSALPSLRIRILTHNIRFATKTPFRGELPWPDRRPVFLSHLRYHTRQITNSIICLQEVLHAQILDIESSLGPEWHRLGVGRNNGKQAGEYSPIFFRQNEWSLEHYETAWLNEDGSVGKKGWDASNVRIVTCAVLIHEQTGQKILAMNTHLDDQGEVARYESTKIIVGLAEKLRTKFQVAWWFLAGDLNTGVEDDAYMNLNRSNSGFIDAKRYIEVTNDKDKTLCYGDESTCTSFSGNPRKLKRIDFIHLGVDPKASSDTEHVSTSPVPPKDRFHLDCYGVLPNLFEGGIYMSDHRAVVVDVII